MEIGIEQVCIHEPACDSGDPQGEYAFRECLARYCPASTSGHAAVHGGGTLVPPFAAYQASIPDETSGWGS